MLVSARHPRGRPPLRGLSRLLELRHPLELRVRCTMGCPRLQRTELLELQRRMPRRNRRRTNI